MFIGAHFIASNVNLASCFFTSGIPTLNALAGLAGNIEFNLKKELQFEDDVDVSVSLSLYKQDVSDGIGSDIVYQHGKKTNDYKNASMRHQMIGVLRGYLFINIRCVDEDDEYRVLNHVRQPDFKYQLNKCRLSGGLLNLGKNSLVVEHDFMLCLKRTVNFFHFGQTFVLEDVSHLIDDKFDATKHQHRLDSYLDLISIKNSRKSTKKEQADASNNVTDEDEEEEFEEELEEELENAPLDIEEEYLGYLVPVSKGFVLIEHPREKDHYAVRGNFPHSYGETVLGLGRFRSLPSLLVGLKDKKEIKHFFRFPKKSVSDLTLAVVQSHSI